MIFPKLLEDSSNTVASESEDGEADVLGKVAYLTLATACSMFLVCLGSAIMLFDMVTNVLNTDADFQWLAGSRLMVFMIDVPQNSLSFGCALAAAGVTLVAFAQQPLPWAGAFAGTFLGPLIGCTYLLVRLGQATFKQAARNYVQ
ncbi:hypothetical protein HYH02_013366 [Chlamydomonas schloesseri]|uniref:Uncharacterized protein n=1 Tax=Chlamydomonas schloesseri TaxID=2026947 RepID=A0A835SQC1_9CHLO|nr:hypothetical protein HYH02_013366 [Chlamydomonas schloesseri]|eukprot:KAG2431377.1 hypothetical protein HYH02_013366 [Chlamydomonas schloesseri]